MSLLRFDVTSNDWVIFAPERSRRPHEFKQERSETPSQLRVCPFCPGNEQYTPTEIYAVRERDAWKVRVVPNKFPALRVEDEPRRGSDGPFFRHMGGCGAHEVIIESPDHQRLLAHQPVEQIELLLQTLQQRHQDLLRDLRIQAILIFKNHGERAGTSLRHPHWQLIATPVVPRLLRLKYGVATDYFDQTGACVYCDLLQEELKADERVIAANDHFAAVMPYAAHVPFETWILPKQHQASFGQVDRALFRPLAEILKHVLLKLYVGLEDPHFNLTIDTVPRGDEDKDYFLWHMQILPRLTTPAGFELGSGMSINLILPEEAADFLRKVQV